MLIRADLGLATADRIADGVARRPLRSRDFRRRGEGGAGGRGREGAGAGRAAARHRSGAEAVRHPGRRRQRLRQDHDHRQARGKIPRRGPHGHAGRRRHVPRRRDRAAEDLGRRAPAPRSSRATPAPTPPASPSTPSRRRSSAAATSCSSTPPAACRTAAELMDELEKIVRVIKKVEPTAPHAVLLVLDATVGQNALSQVEIFQQDGGRHRAGDDQARRHRARRHPGGDRGKSSNCRCISSASARASTIWRRFRRAISPAPSPDLKHRAHDKSRRRRYVSRNGNDAKTAAQSVAQARARSRAAGAVLLRQFAATASLPPPASFMVAVLAALAVSYAMTRHLPIMPVVTAVIVVGVRRADARPARRDLHQDQADHHLRCCSAPCCSAGLCFNKPLLGMVFDSLFHLTEEGWRKLTWRWAIFFLRARGAQRDRLAQFLDRCLGRLQGVRRDAADLRVRLRCRCRCSSATPSEPAESRGNDG